MTYVRLGDGARLWIETSGTDTGVPPVVLVHGGPGMWDYLAPVAGLIDDVAVVHRFDQRGCGRSDPSSRQTMAQLVGDLEALRIQWSHDRWTVIGHSFGATLALLYAATNPDRVSALGYVSGVGVGDWHSGYRAERRARMSQVQTERLATLQATDGRDRLAEREFRALSWFTDHADREHAWEWAWEDAGVGLPINHTANEILNAECDAWSDEYVRAQAARATAPVTVIHGAGDPRPESTVRALASSFQTASVHVIPGAGHHPWREQPDVFRDLVRTHVCRLRLPGRPQSR